MCEMFSGNYSIITLPSDNHLQSADVTQSMLDIEETTFSLLIIDDYCLIMKGQM